MEFIIGFLYIALALGCFAYEVDELFLKIALGLLGAGCAMISVLEIIYGDPEPPFKPRGPTPDAAPETD